MSVARKDRGICGPYCVSDRASPVQEMSVNIMASEWISCFYFRKHVNRSLQRPRYALKPLVQVQKSHLIDTKHLIQHPINPWPIYNTVQTQSIASFLWPKHEIDQGRKPALFTLRNENIPLTYQQKFKANIIPIRESWNDCAKRCEIYLENIHVLKIFHVYCERLGSGQFYFTIHILGDPAVCDVCPVINTDETPSEKRAAICYVSILVHEAIGYWLKTWWAWAGQESGWRYQRANKRFSPKAMRWSPLNGLVEGLEWTFD